MPAIIYSLIIPKGPWVAGWGVPIATDTAFDVALIAALGARVPIELCVFLTAPAVVDDIGAILVIALFYAADVQFRYFGAAATITGMLALLIRAHLYRISLYLVLAAVLWACILASGLHAALEGVILAVFIPTRPQPTVIF